MKPSTAQLLRDTDALVARIDHDTHTSRCAAAVDRIIAVAELDSPIQQWVVTIIGEHAARQLDDTTADDPDCPCRPNYDQVYPERHNAGWDWHQTCTYGVDGDEGGDDLLLWTGRTMHAHVASEHPVDSPEYWRELDTTTTIVTRPADTWPHPTDLIILDPQENPQ